MTILNIYNSYYKHIPLDVFNVAVAADPTSYNQGQVVKVGNFVKWILKLYTNGSWKSGDIFETKDLLTKFIKYKSKLPIDKRDINRFNSVSELYSLMQTLENDGVKTQSEVKKEGAEVVYEDSEWKIVIPHTEEASCIYGAHTKWCTAGREHNMFDCYNEKGRLYININKVTGDKYQFHFETNSFMDAKDEKISPRKIGLSEGAIEYYKSIGKEFYFIYDYVGDFTEGFAGVYKKSRGWNWIDTNGELFWKGDIWFDLVWNFSEGIALFEIEGRGYNWIDINGELIWKGDKWFDNAYAFFNGFATIELEGKGWNWIDTNGELFWKGDIWFDLVWNFSEGIALFEIEGRGWNFINPQGELLWDKYKNYDDVYNFYNGFASVKIEEKGWNWIDTNGELLWKGDKWFDEVGNFYEGFACVKIEGKGWNFINEKGELVWKRYKYFDRVDYYYDGFTVVYIDNKLYKLNTKGELIEI